MAMFKKAFTMLELIFVIVVMGIIGTIGAEIFRNTYDTYMSSSVNNRLQSDTELALKQIANRLQYRLRDSIIARETPGGFFAGLSSALPDHNYTAVEWVGYDVDGWLGDANTTPTWSGFIDVDDFNASNLSLLSSPASDFKANGRVDQVIKNLGGNGVNDAAIFFTGANTDVQEDYGWNSATYDINDTAAHPIATAADIDEIKASAAYTFAGQDVYEQYKLSWTAYALALEDEDNDGKVDELMFYSNYQPWLGDVYQNNGTATLLMDNVQTFKFQAVGDVIKVQICVDNNATGNVPANQIYSLCKEKVVF